MAVAVARRRSFWRSFDDARDSLSTLDVDDDDDDMDELVGSSPVVALLLLLRRRRSSSGSTESMKSDGSDFDPDLD
jgi:hypothetical protein